jgi:hypothetical protein
MSVTSVTQGENPTGNLFICYMDFFLLTAPTFSLILFQYYILWNDALTLMHNVISHK